MVVLVVLVPGVGLAVTLEAELLQLEVQVPEGSGACASCGDGGYGVSGTTQHLAMIKSGPGGPAWPGQLPAASSYQTCC